MRILVLLVPFVLATSAERITYDGYKVYRVTPQNEEQFKSLVSLSKDERFDFWSPLRFGKPLDVMVQPSLQGVFVDFAHQNSIPFAVLIPDVEKVNAEERARQLIKPKLQGESRISFDTYYRHAEINAYLEHLARQYPSLVSLESIGQSYEGRNLLVIKISTDPSQGKPVIFVDAGIHAREWVAPVLALYIINQLVENPSNAGLLNKVDWHILPLVNPDGYEYSHTNRRLWRKTRSRRCLCYGVDGNRNFGFHWGEPGSSRWRCSNAYRGREAFSEVETRALRDYILAKKDYIKLYFTVHSYGGYLLFPWGYTTEESENNEELLKLGRLASYAIRTVTGTIYTVGTSSNLLYVASGASDDWAKGVADIKLCYTIELRGGGDWGFDPPTQRILGIVDEAWAGVKVLHRYIADNYGQSQ